MLSSKFQVSSLIVVDTRIPLRFKMKLLSSFFLFFFFWFQVLECCWADLKKQVAEASDLDHIIAAHETFLDQVLNRCLLDAESRVRNKLNRPDCHICDCHISLLWL